MALIQFEKFDPVQSMLDLQEEIDRFMRNPAFNLGVSGYGSYPPVNIFDDGEGMTIVAELPGLDPAALKISGHHRTITINGERKRGGNGAIRGFHRRERQVGEFSRSIQLPEDLDMSKAAAKYENGILTLHIPKAESAKPRQIAVQSA